MGQLNQKLEEEIIRITMNCFRNLGGTIPQELKEWKNERVQGQFLKLIKPT